MIALGDYVLASQWSDADLNDPWRVGYLCQIIYTWNRPPCYVVGEADGTKKDAREYRYVRPITAEEAAARLRAVADSV